MIQKWFYSVELCFCVLVGWIGCWLAGAEAVGAFGVLLLRMCGIDCKYLALSRGF